MIDSTNNFFLLGLNFDIVLTNINTHPESVWRRSASSCRSIAVRYGYQRFDGVQSDHLQYSKNSQFERKQNHDQS